MMLVEDGTSNVIVIIGIDSSPLTLLESLTLLDFIKSLELLLLLLGL
jgi:hypothetical protein